MTNTLFPIVRSSSVVQSLGEIGYEGSRLTVVPIGPRWRSLPEMIARVSDLC